MSATPGAEFRATVTAAGFVLDAPVIGTAEAAERVLAGWQEGAALHALPDGRWLLTLVEPVEARADRAPGLPVVRTDSGGLSAVGADPAPAAPGRLALSTGGVTAVHRLSDLTELDPSGWLDPSGLTLHRPRPVGPAEPEAAPVREDLPQRPRPDLRKAAGIGPRSERARRLTEGDHLRRGNGDGRAGGRRRRFVGRLRPPSWAGRQLRRSSPAGRARRTRLAGPARVVPRLLLGGVVVPGMLIVLYRQLTMKDSPYPGLGLVVLAMILAAAQGDRRTAGAGTTAGGATEAGAASKTGSAPEAGSASRPGPPGRAADPGARSSAGCWPAWRCAARPAR
ncbi:bpX6 domain-containing protein [Kitasatospora aburaviensis]